MIPYATKRRRESMSNIEHLIENALVATEKSKDTYQAFSEEISKCYNQQMLEDVSMTEDELWDIVQYLLFVWLPNRRTTDESL